MDEIEIRERLTVVEQRSKSNTHQIAELKPIVEEIHTMSKTLVAMAHQLEATNKNVSNLGNKVDALEKEPVTRLAQIKTAVITALATALVSGIVGAVLFSIK